MSSVEILIDGQSVTCAEGLPLTEVRMVAGTAAVLALAAVLAVGLGAILRSGAAAVTALNTLSSGVSVSARRLCARPARH